MQSWPTTLPKFRLPLQEQAQDQTLRTSMDAGPEKVRRRFTAAVRRITVPLRVTGEQKTVLDQFFNDELGGGALAFEMDDPSTDQPAEYRFLGPYSSRLIVGSDDPGKRLYDLQLNLERMP